MKNLLLLLCLISAYSTNGQISERVKALIKFEKGQDSISRTVFLDASEIKGLKLMLQSNTRQIWRSTNSTSQDIEQFYDIRFKFDSNAEALAFHKEYENENAEFGPKIKKHKVKTTGAEEFAAYKGATMVNKMSAPYGLQMYCYLFVVDNYFVKFYISCKKTLAPNIIQPYLTAVIKKIKN